MFEAGKCGLSRRGFVFKGIFAAGASVIAPSEAAQPSQGQSSNQVLILILIPL